MFKKTTTVLLTPSQLEAMEARKNRRRVATQVSIAAAALVGAFVAIRWVEGLENEEPLED